MPRTPAASSSSSRKRKASPSPAKPGGGGRGASSSKKAATKGEDPDLRSPKEKKTAQITNYFKLLSRGPPKHLGSKEVPVGKSDCLKGLTFVQTGVMDSFDHDDITRIIEKYGGRKTSAVSRKTNYLLVGEDAGATKTNKAKELKVPFMTEDEFLDLIRKSNPNAQPKAQTMFGVADSDEEEEAEVSDEEPIPRQKAKPKHDSVDAAKSKSPVKLKKQPEAKLPVKIKKEPKSKISPPSKGKKEPKDKSPLKGKKEPEDKSPLKGKKEPKDKSPLKGKKEWSVTPPRTRKSAGSPSPSKKPTPTANMNVEKNKTESEGAESSCSSSASGPSTQTYSSISTSSIMPLRMWVDKYKPRSLKNLVGQAGDRSNASKLLKWVQNWFQYHGKSDDKAKTSWPGLKDPEGKSFKAALLSGSPGIGKTTMAHLVCEQLGLDYIELNASDTRNKKGLHGVLSDALSSKRLLNSASGSGGQQMGRKHVLIMDEVDGMSGNEDRGGIQELIQLIKAARVPIICICNDRNHIKIRSLANYCFDLRCYKPTVEQLKGFIQSICFKEKMKIAFDSVVNLIKSTDFDIRQIVNQLELYKQADVAAMENNKQVQVMDGNATGYGGVFNPKKDLSFSPFEVCRKVFSASEHQGMSIQDKNNLFFQDYSFGPLFVQENYPRWTPAAAKGSTYKTLDLLKSASESIATGELVESLIRRSNNWSLLPTQAIFSSILPGEFMEGNESTGIDFPKWLGQNSHKNKNARLLQQLHTHVHLNVSGSLEALNLDYLPYLRRAIVNPMLAGDVSDSVQVMQDYDLVREDLDGINEIGLWPGMKNAMEKLDSKTKAAFTRQVNKEVAVPYSVVKAPKGRKKAAGEEDELGELGEGEEAAAESEEEEEKVETDAMIKMKKRKTAQTEHKASTSSSSTAKGKGSKGEAKASSSKAKTSSGSKTQSQSGHKGRK